MFKKTAQVGFSLVELIIVIGIAGSILFAVANLPFVVGIVGASRDESLSSQIATETIENLRFGGFSQLSDGPHPLNDPRLSKLPQGSGFYLVENCPSTICPTPELAQKIKQVKLEISWKKAGKDYKNEVTTFISDGGIR